MSAAKFTPGPLYIWPHFHANGQPTIELRNVEGGTICTYDSEDQMPDALLHKAAPEMYATLEDAAGTIESAVAIMEEDCRDMNGMREFAAEIRELLKKARGES